MDGDGQQVVINLRFAGQYYDAESGLHQNYFRSYDPNVGRYITSDPIGLFGGINTYTYVEANPINKIDSNGLIGLFLNAHRKGLSQQDAMVISNVGNQTALGLATAIVATSVAIATPAASCKIIGGNKTLDVLEIMMEVAGALDGDLNTSTDDLIQEHNKTREQEIVEFQDRPKRKNPLPHTPIR